MRHPPLLVSLSPCLLVLAATAAHAQTPPPTPAPQSPEQTAAFLAPYTNPDTLLLAHIDLDQVDLPALFTFFDQFLAKIPDTDETRKALPLAQSAAAAALARLHTLGIRHAYIITDQSDLTVNIMNPNSSIIALGGALLIPLPPNTDPKTVLAFLHSINLDPTNQITDPVLLPNNILFLGAPTTAARLRAPSPSPVSTQTLTAAFASPNPSAPSALQIVALLSPDVRRVLTQIPFNLPPELGGKSTTTFTDGLQSATLSLHLPPNPSIALRLCAENPAAAAGLAAALNDLLTTIPKTPWFTTDLHTAPPEIKTSIQNLLTSQHFTPDSPTAPAATLTLSTDALTTAINTLLAPGLENSREVARRATAAAYLHQLMIACQTYADAHNGQLPPTLQTLVDQNLITDPKLLQSPRSLKDQSLAYHPWTPDQLKKITPSQAPMIWEHPDTPSDGLTVAYADGHIEFVRDQKSVDDALKEQEAKAK